MAPPSPPVTGQSKLSLIHICHLLANDLLGLILGHLILAGYGGEIRGAKGVLGRGGELLVIDLDVPLLGLLEQHLVARIRQDHICGGSGVGAVLILDGVEAVLALDRLARGDLVGGAIKGPRGNDGVELVLREGGGAHALGAKRVGPDHVAQDRGDDHGNHGDGDVELVAAAGNLGGIGGGVGVLGDGVFGGVTLVLDSVPVLGGIILVLDGVEELGIGLDLALRLGGGGLAGDVLGSQSLMDLDLDRIGVIVIRPLTATDDLDTVDVLLIVGVVLLHDQTHEVLPFCLLYTSRCV